MKSQLMQVELNNELNNNTSTDWLTPNKQCALVETWHLRYTQMISDGDSKSLATLNEHQPWYGDLKVDVLAMLAMF